eukprot:8897506-Pyramimonas_sp.AAC.1
MRLFAEAVTSPHPTYPLRHDDGVALAHQPRSRDSRGRYCSPSPRSGCTSCKKYACNLASPTASGHLEARKNIQHMWPRRRQQMFPPGSP